MKNILLCDDSELILTALDRRLSEAGFKIAAKVKDGDQCIEAYRQLMPDLVILDGTMPNKDGKQCLEEIMAMDPDALVVMVSALGDKSIQEQCLKQGAKAFINKASLSSVDDFNRDILSVINTVMAR